jgi:uncharacterized protein (DUF1015 family)
MRIFPFRAYHYDKKKVGNLSDVVTQPYDKITPAMQAAYYEKHPRNIVRVILNREPGQARYDRGAEAFRALLDEKAIVRDAKPAIYASYQEYKDDAGRTRVRKGLVALLELEEFGGAIKPHERTLAGPKVDRLNLMRTTHGTFGQIFMLYSDPEKAVNAILDAHAESRPALEATDEMGETHRVWRVTPKKDVDAIVRLMESRQGFIADGHHRYETALNYRNEMRAKGAKCEGLETFDRLMMTFVNMDDEGLTIFPTHRLVHDADEAKVKALPKVLDEDFAVHAFPFDAATEREVRAGFLAELRAAPKGEHRIGMALRGEPAYYLLTLRDESVSDAFFGTSHGPAWKRLDVSVLHGPILEKRLGIGAEALEKETNVKYVRHADPALDSLAEPGVQAVFLLNGTKIQEVHEVAGAGERMPQKSTDFYPKLLTGLLINKFNIVRS